MAASQDGPSVRCYGKIRHERAEAIAEATRLGYPVNPYKCPNGYNHWHVGNSTRSGKVFHRQRDRWERQARNQDEESSG